MLVGSWLLLFCMAAMYALNLRLVKPSPLKSTLFIKSLMLNDVENNEKVK